MLLATSRISSLAKNPDSGYTPANASAPTMNVTPVTGIFRSRPPICFMSVWSCIPCITDPAPRNIRAL